MTDVRQSAENARAPLAAEAVPAGEVVVVMGVSGCGKTTIASSLAARTNSRHLDADDLHPQANVDKMTAGIPLTDEDRHPWLEAIRRELDARVAAGERPVLACSALKEIYRDVLRDCSAPLRFVYLKASKEELLGRVSGRGGHFFPATLLDSQFAALEEPGPDENHSTVPATEPVAVITDMIVAAAS